MTGSMTWKAGFFFAHQALPLGRDRPEVRSSGFVVGSGNEPIWPQRHLHTRLPCHRSRVARENSEKPHKQSTGSNVAATARIMQPTSLQAHAGHRRLVTALSLNRDDNKHPGASNPNQKTSSVIRVCVVVGLHPSERHWKIENRDFESAQIAVTAIICSTMQPRSYHTNGKIIRSTSLRSPCNANPPALKTLFLKSPVVKFRSFASPIA
jgi:hypothetical protein